MTLGGNSVTANADATIACPLAGSAGLTKTGSGILTLSASNVFTGPVIVSAGILSIGADAALGAVPASAEVDQLTLDGGTLQTSATVSLNANRGVTLTPNGGVFCVAGSGQTTTINGIVAGSGNLIKTGAGNLILPVANTYTGGTTIGAGTLTIGHGGTAGSLGASAAIISNSGTLAFDRTDNYGGAWSSGISGPGSVTVVAGSLAFSGSNSCTAQRRSAAARSISTAQTPPAPLTLPAARPLAVPDRRPRPSSAWPTAGPSTSARTLATRSAWPA